MEQNGNTVIPLRSSLPEKCFSVLETTGELIILKRGEKGYQLAGVRNEAGTPREGADALNRALDVTKAQEAAMVAGSMFGWAVPGADPKSYDENGRAIPHRSKDRGDAR